MASSIVKSTVEKLGTLLVDEAKSLYKVRERIENLQAELEWVECFLRDADTQQHQDRIICKWVSQVRDFAYDGEDIIERYLNGISHHRQDGIWNTLKWFPRILYTCDAWTLHNLGSEIDNLTGKMSNLSSRLQRYGIQVIRPTRSLEYNNMMREERRTYSHTEEDVVGLETDIEQVVDRLVNTDVKVVSICGIGGLGKTTLVRKVYKHNKIKDHFNGNCAWVYISKEFDKINIFQEILHQLEKGEEGRKMNEESIKVKGLSREMNNNNDDANRTKRNNDAKMRRPEELPGEISKLLQGKRCLVVIDDIWTVEAWERLRPAFESIFTTPLSSSKILITTRDTSLIHDDGPCVYLHPLKTLTPDNSWELLKRKAFIGVPGSPGGESSTNAKEHIISQNKSQGGESSTNAKEHIISQNKSQGRESSTNAKEHIISQNKSQDDDQVKSEGQSEMEKLGKEMEKLGKEMLVHCDGLPIAILALGGILSTKKTISEWKDVRTNISSYLMNGVRQEAGKSRNILEILELSYNELPFYLKPCFLYLGIFPEDYEISTQRLYHLWEAEGFLAIEVGAKKMDGTSYDIGGEYLDELVQRSLVQVGKCWERGRIKTCRVHDVMRDMCLRKCEEVSFLSHIEPTESGTVRVLAPFSVEIKKPRRCALHGKDIRQSFQFGEKAIGLRSLLVFKKRCSLRNLWESVPLLRVLDLQGVESSHRRYGFEHLIHLRYLSLRKSNFDQPLSCLYELQYLETLDLRCIMFENYLGKSYRVMLIRNKLYKMKRLRHLYLPKYFKVEGDRKLIFPGGDQIETIKNFHPKRCETGELMKMTNLRVFSITKEYVFTEVEELKRVLEAPVMRKLGQLINNFHIEIHEDVICEDPAILRSTELHPNFKQLILTSDHKHWSREPVLKDDFDLKLPKCLTRVELRGCYKIGIGDFFLGLENLPHLQVLEAPRDSVITGTGRGTNVSFSAGSFQHLTKLHISTLNTSRWEVGKGAIPNLQELSLHDCKNLNNLQNIPNSLTQVEFQNCKITEGDVSALGNLPHLKYLDIAGYRGEKLCFPPASFLELTRLSLQNQNEGVFKEWEIGQGAVPSLQILNATRWGGLLMLPDSLTQVKFEYCALGEGDASVFPNFSCLEKLPHLQVLEVYGGSGGNKIMRFSPGSFTQLRELSLSILKNLEELEIEEDALPHLQLLMLKFCGNLKKLNRLPDSLTQVDIESCNLLGEQSDLLFDRLKKLTNLQVLSLSGKIGGRKLSFPPGSFPQLTHLRLFSWLGRKVEVGEGALSNLQRLDMFGCDLKKLPEGLPESVHIECCICIPGIEKYNTCPYFKRRVHLDWELEPMRTIQWKIREFIYNKCPLLTN